MIIGRLKGGLGNQMFQYAVLRALSLKYKKKIYLDLESVKCTQLETDSFTPRGFSLNIFKIKASPLPNFFRYILKLRTVLKRIIPVHFNLFLNNYNDNSDFNVIKYPAYLDGYFQSENYFKEFRQQMLDDFSLKFPLGKDNEILLEDIIKHQSISLHFRRGDYVDKPQVALYHGVCSSEYYKIAMDYFRGEVTSSVFYIFTDDPIWVKNNFINLYPFYKMILVNINQGVDSWKDMYLMSKCKHNIIANSSFSWWGAWLNQNPDKIVIAPKQWFADPYVNSKSNNLIPASWVKI